MQPAHPESKMRSSFPILGTLECEEDREIWRAWEIDICNESGGERPDARRKAWVAKSSAWRFVTLLLRAKGWNCDLEAGLYLIDYFEVETCGLAKDYTRTELDKMFAGNFHVRHRMVFEDQNAVGEQGEWRCLLREPISQFSRCDGLRQSPQMLPFSRR